MHQFAAMGVCNVSNGSMAPSDSGNRALTDNVNFKERLDYTLADKKLI
jgi:hypothetical protein